MKKLILWAVGIVALYLFMATTQGHIDCSRYHSDTFHGVYVGCGGGK